MYQRDEFPKNIKETLAKRVGTLCSNPQCSVPTYGPSIDVAKSLSKGVAAHIRAASPGGPRWDSQMTPEERKAIANGIWLCESCADLIDADVSRFAIEILERWRRVAEERATKALENPRIVNVGADFADTVLLVTVQNSFVIAPSPSSGRSGRYRRKITLKPLKADRSLIDPMVPIALGTDLCPAAFCLIKLSCQNQGTGVDQYVKFDLVFLDGQPAVQNTQIDSQRVILSEGGREGASVAKFFVRELLPNEVVSASVIARAGIEFEAHLWTQNSANSPEVFIYEIVIGEEERMAGV